MNRPRFAFAKCSGAMKAPVGLLSDRAVLRQQDGGASPRQAPDDKHKKNPPFPERNRGSVPVSLKEEQTERSRPHSALS